MHSRYAPAKTVYQVLRTAVAPWAKSHGFRRWPATQAGWQKTIDAGLLGFKFEGYSMVNPDIGTSLSGAVQLESAGQAIDGPIRQSPFSCCLMRAELDRLAQIQGTINRRRPPIPHYLEKDAQEDSLLGHYLRELYAPDPQFREGQLVPFSYHSIEDVRDLVGFIVAVLPDVVDRFLEGRVAKPIDTTPPHLRPKWLGRSEDWI
jgi:hypothetical protein